MTTHVHVDDSAVMATGGDRQLMTPGRGTSPDLRVAPTTFACHREVVLTVTCAAHGDSALTVIGSVTRRDRGVRADRARLRLMTLAQHRSHADSRDSV